MIASAAMLVLVLGGTGHAQSAHEARDFDVERFQPTSARTGILGTEAGAPIAAGTWDLGLVFGLADDVLVVDDGTTTTALVSRRTTATFVGAIGLRDRLELGFAVPVILDQERPPMLGDTTTMLAPLSDGLGDLRIVPKLGLIRGDFALALVAALTLPTGDGDYRGDGGLTFAPAIAASRDLGRLALAANLGARLRDSSHMLNLRVDDELFTEVGASYRTGPVLSAQLGMAAATAAAAPFAHANQTHVELRTGLGIELLPALFVSALAGVGVQHGYGTPDWRAVIAVRVGGH